MPSMTTLEIQASSVRKGDFLESLGATVTEVTSKTKLTTIFVDRLAGPKKTVLPHTDMVLVSRQVPTPEEDRAYLVQLAGESAFREIVKAYENVKLTTEEMVRASAFPVDHQWSYLSSHMQVLAERDIWGAVAGITGNGRSLGESVLLIADEMEKKLLGNHYRQNSTSVASNMAQQYAQDAASRFLRSWPVTAFRKVGVQ